MAVTIVATAKGASSNSYITLADAETYMEGRSNTTDWDAATDDVKNRALVTATYRLDQEDFHGSATTDAQALRWPRSGTVDQDDDSYDQDEIPTPVKRATVEVAKALVDGDLELKDTGLEGFRSAKVGALAVTPVPGYKGGPLPEQAKRFLVGLLIASGGLNIRVDRA